jgi:UDP-N-acetylmuramate--alanine ligase
VLLGTADSDSDRVASLLAKPPLRFGLESNADLHVSVPVTSESGSVATLTWPDAMTLKLHLTVPGVHNLRNAVAALGVVKALGGDLIAAAKALADFDGVGRRFERLGEASGIQFVDDYAHHPTELVAALAAARQAYPNRRLVAVFQPHLFSRTREHGAAMGRALAAADLAVVTDIYPARELPIPGVTAELVADAAREAKTGKSVKYIADRKALLTELPTMIREDDLVLTLGAGDITEVGRQILKQLDSQ